METHALNVGGGKRRRSSSHAHKQALVSGTAEWSAFVSAEHRQVTQHMQLHEQQRKIDPRS